MSRHADRLGHARAALRSRLAPENEQCSARVTRPRPLSPSHDLRQVASLVGGRGGSGDSGHEPTAARAGRTIEGAVT